MNKSLIISKMGTTIIRADLDKSEWKPYMPDTYDQVFVHVADPARKIRRYEFTASGPQEYDRANRLYDLRKNSKEIVATLHQDLRIEDGCTMSYSGHFYTEWIPITLQDMTDIPFPDILHLYHQTLTGFGKMV